jgi:hypothetical protein
LFSGGFLVGGISGPALGWLARDMVDASAFHYAGRGLCSGLRRAVAGWGIHRDAAEAEPADARRPDRDAALLSALAVCGDVCAAVGEAFAEADPAHGVATNGSKEKVAEQHRSQVRSPLTGAYRDTETKQKEPSSSRSQLSPSAPDRCGVVGLLAEA